MSITKSFIVYSSAGRRIDMGTDKAELQAQYPASKGFLILPLVR